MILSWLLTLALLPTRVLGLEWETRWDKFRKPVAGHASGFGSNYINALACGWFSFISGFIAFVSISAIIWGATTMQGTAIDEGRKEEGKKIIIGGIIGLVWAVLAKSIVEFLYEFINRSPGTWPCGELSDG